MIWFMVMVSFSDGKAEYLPFGKPYETYAECMVDVRNTKSSVGIGYQCFEKDILIALLKKN